MIEINNTTKAKISKKRVTETVEKFLKHYKLSNKDVSIALVGRKKIRELNKVYRKKDSVTDVLSFVGEEDLLGEIIICPDQVKKQAKDNKKTFGHELIFVLIHGLLHLKGETHETEDKRQKIIKKGEKLIKELCLV